MSPIQTTLPGKHGAVSDDEYGSIQQPVSQHGDKIALDAAEHSVGHSSQSNSTAYDVVSQSGGNQFRTPFDRQPELRGRYNETHYPFYEDWNKQLADHLEITNSNNDWKYSFQKMNYSLRSWLFHLTEEELQQPPPQPPVELRPPSEAIRNFTSVLISQHFPTEITRNLANSANKRETINPKWYIELRHFFIDLPTQLRELEELLTGTSSMSSTNGNEENKADTRALANWTSYQLPAAFAGRYSVSIYPHPRHPNLRYTRRIVFSQRLDIKDNHDQSNHNSRWLAGRWLVVAYLFAATPEAVQKLDVKSILLSACTPGRGNMNTMSSLNAYKLVKNPRSRWSRWPSNEQWWLLPMRNIFFQLQRYDDEMLATAFIPQNPNDYHRPYAYRNNYDSSAPYYKRHMERRLRDMERRLHDIEQLRPLSFVRARHGHDRCQLIDRMWPALMTGQDIKKQIGGVKAAGTTCGDACGASTTTSSISSTSSTPSTSGTSSQSGTTTSDDDDEGSDSFLFSMVIGFIGLAAALSEIRPTK